MRRMASLRAAPPPLPAGRDVASQRVRASHQPVSTFAACHPFTSSKHLQYTESALVYFAGDTVVLFQNVKHQVIDILVPVFVSGGRRRYSCVACIDTRCLDLFQKHNEHPLKAQTHTHTHTHTTRSVSPAEDSPPVSLSHLSGCVSPLYYVRRMLRAERKSHRKCHCFFFLPLLPPV